MSDDFLKSLIGIGGVPFILGLTQLLKSWVSDTRWYAPISVLWGLAINIGLAYAMGAVDRQVFIKTVFMGIMAGLAACGLYSASSTVTEGPLADKSKRKDIPPSPPGR